MSVEFASTSYSYQFTSSGVSVTAGAAAAAESVSAEEAAAKEGEAKKETQQDTFEYRQKGANAVDGETIKAMKDELESRTQNLVRQMLGQQADTLAITDENFWQKFRTGEFKATPEQQAEAQQAIAEDGYWGVEQTSDRFIKYAKALMGGDPEQFEKVLSGFEKGFEAAKKAWGGELPELSQNTYTRTKEKFDELKKEMGIGSDD